MKLMLWILFLLLTAPSFTQEEVTVENICYSAGDTLTIDEIRFPTCSYGKYGNLSRSPLDSLAEILLAHPKMTIRIENHTDSRGNLDRNRELSLNRSQLMRDYLVDKGVNADRITAIGFGEDKPLKTERYINQFRRTDKQKFEMLHQRNRRTLFIVTAI